MSRWESHDPRMRTIWGYPATLVLDVDGEQVVIDDAIKMWPEDKRPWVDIDHVLKALEKCPHCGERRASG